MAATSVRGVCQANPQERSDEDSALCMPLERYGNYGLKMHPSKSLIVSTH
jgi:hypothetical protein